LPPGDFSPYSTDVEWEEYYEKKDRFENQHPMHQLSWSSYGRDKDDEDESISGAVEHHHCDCAVAFDRTKEWVADLKSMAIQRWNSEELLWKCGSSRSAYAQHVPIRCRSALSCLSLERLPILEPPTSSLVTSSPGSEVPKHRRSSSISLPLPPKSRRSSLPKRSKSVPRTWKTTRYLLNRNVVSSSLCELRRERYMYPRALSGCRYRVYGAGEPLAAESRRRHRRARREFDLPDQWIKRDEGHRHDFLKSTRFKLEAREQRSIPVVWCTRFDPNEPRLSEVEDFDMEEDEQDVEVLFPVERPECALKYPIAVYNPPPTWNMLMQFPQNEKRNDPSPERLEQSSSEPSAFQPVLQRPQPIDLNALEVDLETDEESDEKMPKWPLLKKLREAERELLAAGNPIAIERQKIREYNRHLRSEMVQEQDLLEEQLRQMHQLYLEYFAAQQLILAQDLEGSNQIGEGRTNVVGAVSFPLIGQTGPADQSSISNEGESLIEVLHVDPTGENREVLEASSSADAEKGEPVQVEDSECTASSICVGDGANSNVDVEQGSPEPVVSHCT
ncbi:hypothetical protein GCK32_011163, partial [Trichostrongylus colubriformis]